MVSDYENKEGNFKNQILHCNLENDSSFCLIVREFYGTDSSSLSSGT